MKKVLTIVLMALAITSLFVSCNDHKHSYGPNWKYNTKEHWYECSCGDKKDVGEHKFGDYTVKNGSVIQICSICKYEKTVEDAEAVLDEKSLSTAITKEGINTIVLGEDITLTQSINISKEVTIDLGGKTVTLAITGCKANDGAFVLPKADNAYSVTVKNGKITGKVSMSGASATSDSTNTFALYDNSSLTLDGIEMDVTCKRGIQVRDLCKNVSISVKGSTLKVKDGIDGVYVIATNASVEKGSTSDVITINISNSTLEATSVANDKCGSTGLLLNVPGTYTITDSKIKGERQAAIFRGGTYKVSGSTFEYTTNNEQNKAFESKDWSSGNDVPNAAIVIGNRSASAYEYKTDVTFSGTNTLNVPTAEGVNQLYVYQANATNTVTVTGADSSWSVNTDKNSATYTTK